MTEVVPAQLLLDPQVLDHVALGCAFQMPDAAVLNDWILEHQDTTEYQFPKVTDKYRAWLIYHALREIRTFEPKYGLDNNLAWLCLTPEVAGIRDWCESKNQGSAYLSYLQGACPLYHYSEEMSCSIRCLARTATETIPIHWYEKAISSIQPLGVSRYYFLPRAKPLFRLSAWLPPIPAGSFDFLYPTDVTGSPIIP